MLFQAILTSIALTTGMLLSFPALTHAKTRSPTSAQIAPDDALLEMSQAFKQGDTQRLRALRPQIQGHALEPWGAYWELSARLADASPEEIRAFLTRYAGTYQEDRLRADWLLLLGKQGDWDTFMAEYPKYRMKDDRATRCYALLAEFNHSSAADVAAQVRELWLAQREADEGCAAAAQQQLAAGQLTPLTVWHRARLGVENDRLRIASQAVGLLNADWVSTVNALYASPAHYLDKKILALRPRTKELVTLALVRLATKDPEAAAVQLNKLRWKTQLTQEERSWVWGVIGKRAARSLSGEALGFFANGQDHLMHDDHLAWKARAALRAGAWDQVQEAIAAMSAPHQHEPTWVYWRARALLALKAPGAQAQAKSLYESIASASGFYEQLALEDLGRQVTPPARPAPPSEKEMEEARHNTGLARGLQAIELGLRNEGVREWNYSVGLHQPGGMTDRELLAAAQLACDNGVWDRCINTSERTKAVADFEQRYPMPFKAAVVQRTAQIGLDPAYVYGLIRQESRFIMDARSGVGASGLMQVMPATARWTARKIGLKDFKPHQITERDINLTIGTGYLKLVLDNFGGSMPLATAAYNAGPNRPRNWRGQNGGPVMEAAIWIENVPFAETRDYVKKVMANTTNYAALLSGRPQSLKARLGTVGPRAISADEPDPDLP